MVKVTDNCEKRVELPHDFPILMRHKNGFVVLFTSATEGVVISPNKEKGRKLGDHELCWSLETCPSSWRVVTNPIVLENVV
jgi:hypothetical protein